MQALTMLRLMVMMFLQFFIWGAWYVTAPRYLQTIGFTGADLGWTYSVGPIAGIITPFFVGMIADRFFSTERVLGVMHLAGAGLMYAATQFMQTESPTPTLINGLFFGYMLTFYPTLALTNALSMHNLQDSEKQFPLVRVFGTGGWIIAGVVLAMLNWGDKVEMFYLTSACAAALGVYCFTLPHTPPPSKGQKTRIGELFGLDAFVLLKKPSFLVFIICSFLICIPLAFYYQLAERTVAQSELAYPPFKMTFGQMSEVFFMLLMPVFFVRLGVKWMLFVGMLAWVIRYALFAIGAPDNIAWMILVGVALHGICYDFFFVTGQIYTDKVADKRIRGQAQGMLVLFTLGFGMMIGAQIAGRIESALTPAITGQLAADVKAISDAVDASQATLDSELADLSDSQQSQVESTYDELVSAEQASPFAMVTDVERKVSQAQLAYNELADEKTAEVRKEIRGLPEDPDEEQLAGLRDEQLEILRTTAVEQAQDDLAAISDSDVRDAVTTQLVINRLNGYRESLSLRSLQAMNWKMIWLIPCIFAGVIMVIFAFTFKDDASSRDGSSAEADETASSATADSALQPGVNEDLGSY